MRFKQTAVAHEYFHILLNGKRGLLRKLIKRINIDDFLNKDTMIKFGYMYDDSLNSRINAMEDCIIRAMCGVVMEDKDIESYCKTNIQCGFVGVPAMIEKINEIDFTQLNINDIISKMTESY